MNNSSVFYMPKSPEIEDIQYYLNLGSESYVSLWMLQQPGAVRKLKACGELRGDKAFAYTSKPVSLGKEGAYSWLVEQASKRQPGLWTDLPIWLSFHEQEDSRYENDTSIQVIVSKHRILPCFYDPWVEMLHIFSMIYKRDWPTLWLGTRPDLDPFEEKQADCFIPPAPSEATCRKSWESIFTIELGVDQRLAWSRTLQAVLPKITIEDMVGEKLVPQSEYHAEDQRQSLLLAVT